MFFLCMCLKAGESVNKYKKQNAPVLKPGWLAG